MVVNQGALVTEDGEQDLSNKILVSPILNTPTLNSPTVTGPFRAEIDNAQADIDALQAIDHSHLFTLQALVTTITPVANTPTSKTLSGLGMDNSTYYPQVTPESTVVGSEVKGVAATEADNTSVKVWIYRTNTSNTNLFILMPNAGDPVS